MNTIYAYGKERKLPVGLAKDISVVLKKSKKIEKIFPLIGINNCQAKTSSYIKIDGEFVKELLKINNNHNDNDYYYGNYECDHHGKPLKDLYNQSKINYGISLLKDKHIKDGIIINDVLSVDNDILLKKGQKLSSVLKKQDSFNYYLLSLIEKLKNDRYSIVLSVDGNDCLWDIITMSMRGIESCMSWDSNHSRSLVGSTLDPCCGMIYITDNKPNKIGHGPNMLIRSVIRLTYQSNGQLSLFLEKPYISSDMLSFSSGQLYDDNEDLDEEIDNFILNHVFVPFLNKKIKHIQTKPHVSNIPKTEVTKIIESHLSPDHLSYTDSGLGYSKHTYSLQEIINNLKPKVLNTKLAKAAKKIRKK